MKYIIVLPKVIRLGLWLGKFIGPFETMTDAQEYIRNARATWADPSVFTEAEIDSILEA